jgi:outer membrane protein assembly factor BamB
LNVSARRAVAIAAGQFGEQLSEEQVEIADPVPPSAVDRTVFVGGEDRSLLALNAATGKIRWGDAADAQ